VLIVLLALCKAVDTDISVCVLGIDDSSMAGDILVTEVTMDLV